jgi:hypothetical protein
MTEKVIHEVRFIETDDGFRIEVKGDKERIRSMGFGPGMMGFGPGMHFKRHRRRHGRHGHHKHRHGRGFGPWAWGGWWDEAAEDEDVVGPEKSPQDA